MEKEPIENIVWLPVKSLDANDYNPNVVFNKELKLLEHSILSTGWVQPILISRDKIIIDGFHRWMLSKSSRKIRERYKDQVPCCVLDIPRDQAMLLTVRINRAKGSHVAVRMAEMVKQLIDDHQMDPQQIGVGIGATQKEVDLLYQDGVFKAKNLKDYKYSQAWYPIEKG